MSVATGKLRPDIYPATSNCRMHQHTQQHRPKLTKNTSSERKHCVLNRHRIRSIFPAVQQDKKPIPGIGRRASCISSPLDRISLIHVGLGHYVSSTAQNGLRVLIALPYGVRLHKPATFRAEKWRGLSRLSCLGPCSISCELVTSDKRSGEQKATYFNDIPDAALLLACPSPTSRS